MKPTIKVSLLVVLFFSSLLLVAAQSTSMQIGVVDLNQIFDSHPQKIKMEAELNLLQQKYSDQLKSQDQVIDMLKDEVALLDKHTAAFSAANKKLFTAVQNKKFEMAHAAEEFQTRKLAHHQSLLKNIDQDIQAFAKAHGFQLILQREFKLSEKRNSWHSVLYASEAVDVTAELIKSFGKR